jgi:hypothetical protein
VANKAQLSVREVMLLLVSMLLNAMPAIIVICLYVAYQGSTVNSVATQILDVLQEQPAGWAAEGFNYKNYAQKFPPGPEPFAGADVVYGSRQDLLDAFPDISSSWASTPCVSWRLIIRGYHGVLIPGHPNIGLSDGLWKPNSFLMVSRPGLFMSSTLLMNALFWDKLKGSYGHWLLGVYGGVVAVLIDVWILASAEATGKAKEGLVLNLNNLWLLVHTGIVYFNAKSNCGLVGAFRGIFVPLASGSVFSAVSILLLYDRLEEMTTGSAAGALFVRLILWPILTELCLAPTRFLLRGIPDTWANKYGLSFSMFPLMLAFIITGRVFQYKIIDPLQMTICNFALFGVEMLFRLTVAHRDRAYARALACMSHSGVKQLFGQKNNVKFRCDNLCNEMMLEYYAMFAIFTQNALLSKKANPEADGAIGILILNLVMQVVLEAVCDFVCLYIEITKLKAPIVNAWKGRKSSFPIVFAALTWGIAGFACNGILMGSCAMYSQEKQLVWVNCA